MTIRFLTSGESHGEKLTGIIEGLPAGYELDFDFINSELKCRQQGYGRGKRMSIESDTIKITSGVRFGITTASPLAFEIKNHDFKNWLYPMSIEKIDFSNLDNNSKAEIQNLINEKKISKFRPAHADLAGVQKYNFEDIRNVLERASARETASRTAIGAICQSILKNYNISFYSNILSIGKCQDKNNFKEYIDKFNDDSLGGMAEIKITNVPAGLGSFVNWDRKLDSRLAAGLMSIPAIKSVEVGLGKEYSYRCGSSTHDEICYENGKYKRKSNNSGGIEGGMSNGEDIILTVAMKPIPTLKKPLESVEIQTHKPTKAHFERSDVCAVHAMGVVARNVCAAIILDAFLEKFTSDCKNDIDATYKNYLSRINEV